MWVLFGIVLFVGLHVVAFLHARGILVRHPRIRTTTVALLILTLAASWVLLFLDMLY